MLYGFVKILRCVCLIQREFAFAKKDFNLAKHPEIDAELQIQRVCEGDICVHALLLRSFYFILIVLIPMILLFVVLISLSFTIRKNSVECHMGLFTEPKVSCILFRYPVLIYLFEDIL